MPKKGQKAPEPLDEQIERHNYYVLKFNHEVNREILQVSSLKARRTLLIVAILAIVFVKMGLIPTQITALGITLPAVKTTLLAKALCLFMVYFLCNFVLYTLTDIRLWHKEIFDIEQSLSKDSGDIRDPGQKDSLYFSTPLRFKSRELSIIAALHYVRKMRATALARNLLDIAFPIGLAIYSLVTLLLNKS